MENSKISASASLITQGKHKFYLLTLSIEDLAGACYASTREEDPSQGFQRVLDMKRVDAISEYIENGGVIPGGIILSAQEIANFEYDSKKKTIKYVPSSSR